MCKWNCATLQYRGVGWLLMDCNFIFKIGCDMVWLRVSWKKWTGKYIVDRLPGGPYPLSSGLLWLQLSIPGTRKVIHMCMRERDRERLCVAQEDEWMLSRRQDPRVSSQLYPVSLPYDQGRSPDLQFSFLLCEVRRTVTWWFPWVFLSHVQHCLLKANPRTWGFHSQFS